VLALGDLAGDEAEAAVAPQDDVVDDAAEHLVHGVLHLLLRGLTVLDEDLADAALRLVALALERTRDRRGADVGLVHEQLARAHREPARAREHGAAALVPQVHALLAAGELEPTLRLRELQELQHLGREEVCEVALQRHRPHDFHFTSCTTRSACFAAPVKSRRLYQPITSTWNTVVTSMTPSPISVRRVSPAPSGPRTATSRVNSATRLVMITPVMRPNHVGRTRIGPTNR